MIKVKVDVVDYEIEYEIVDNGVVLGGGDFHAMDSVVEGVCASCGAVEPSCEPDARENFCDACGADAVRSVLVWADLI